MRTKLDEIVEDVLREKGAVDPKWHLTEFGLECERLIAERAFRHGVEQAQWAVATVLPPPGVLYLGRVQPAPAEEPRSAREYVMNAERLTREAWEAFHKGCAHGRCWCKPDRRKGERRKGLERNARVSYHIGPGQSFLIWQIGFTKDWEQDRRSGKDRRK